MATSLVSGRKPPRSKHFEVELDFEKLAWVTIDTQKSSVNVLSREVVGELESIVAWLEDLVATGDIDGVILLSGKSSGFVAGADISEFDEMNDYAILPEALKRTHLVMDRIEKLRAPIAVGIDGFCLGGGLELALACHYRIATRSEKTRLGFPEVNLGIFPGFGGTGRSIRSAGPVDAMRLMLTGRPVSASAARAMNIVDRLVDHRDQLRWEARKAVQQKRRACPASLSRAIFGMGPLRGWVANRMREDARKKARPEHYPAPFALIDLFEKHGNNPHKMIRAEVNAFVPLMASDAATNLRRVFFLQDGLKKQGLRGAARPDFKHVHVIGGGVMGGDIAAWCAYRGLKVTLQDLDMDRIAPALKRANSLFMKRLKTPQKVAAANARLTGDVEGEGLARADVIIEAVVENLEVKKKIFAAAEKRMKPGAILATNTSSIELEKIAEALKDKSSLIGLHFFNPVAQLPLVEIIRSEHNSNADVARGASFALAISKSPVIVKSAPGFLVNRVLMPYMLGAVERVENGESKKLIDEAALAFGMPMGPIELMDVVGLDVGRSVALELGHEVPSGSRFQALVDAGNLGRKTGAGFYKWVDGKPQKSDVPEPKDLAALGRDLLRPLVDECEKCVAEGIVDSADLADIGVILGTGFAPFLGGPLQARSDKKV